MVFIIHLAVNDPSYRLLVNLSFYQDVYIPRHPPPQTLNPGSEKFEYDKSFLR